jgi:ATP/maltotriose-dependent transcriptional regulator MalT
MTTDEAVVDGQTALLEWRWEDARAAFERALEAEEHPAALAGLGDAYFWLGDIRRAIEFREHAYAAYRRAGDAAWAAESAIWLCVVVASALGDVAVANGWRARAERVLGDADVPPLQGWLSLISVIDGDDLHRSLAAAERALEIARECGDVDLELCALSETGLIHVQLGDVDTGLRYIDEAMAGALGGESRLFDTIVYTSCSMLTACDLVADLDRAAQWCRAADEVTGKYGGPYLYAYCRVVYGRVLVITGHWEEAERELERGLEATRDVFPAMHARTLASLADLRIRQGRLADAEALLDRIEHPGESAPVEAVLALRRGEPETAIQLIERWLPLHREGSSGHAHGELSIELGRTLGLLAEAQVAAGDLQGAGATAQRLQELAAGHGAILVAAHAALARGRVTAASGALDVARSCFEEALERFATLSLPLEAAWARLDLARTLYVELPSLATAEARRALATFDRLGASADSDVAAALLRSWGVRGRTGPRAAGVLSRREQEVLELVARGLSNQEIADELYISRKTASHHVSNLLSKLGVRNRAEAAAYAASHAGERPPAS